MRLAVPRQASTLPTEPRPPYFILITMNCNANGPRWLDTLLWESTHLGEKKNEVQKAEVL